MMLFQNSDTLKAGVFITFSGNCKKALTFYQSCFGGTLHFEIFDELLQGYPEPFVISGSLVADSIAIHGSDLVHNEGRKIGNYLSVFLPCKDVRERETLIKKLVCDDQGVPPVNYQEPLIEVTDAFDVRWMLGI